MLPRFKRNLRLFAFAWAELAISYFGLRNIPTGQLWRHPLRVFVVIASLIVTALVSAIIDQIVFYIQQQKIKNKNHVQKRPNRKTA